MDANAGTVRQLVDLGSAGFFQLSVYALPITDRATVTVRVLDGETVFGSVSETLHAPTKWWLRVPMTFRVPPEARRVTIEISSLGSATGEKFACDFVDLAPMEGLNEPLEVTSIGSIALSMLPRPVTIRGKNFLPSDVVRIGKETYCDVTFVSTEELRALIPELTTSGAYDLTVRHDDWLGQAQAVTIQEGLRIEH